MQGKHFLANLICLKSMVAQSTFDGCVHFLLCATQRFETIVYFLNYLLNFGYKAISLKRNLHKLNFT